MYLTSRSTFCLLEICFSAHVRASSPTAVFIYCDFFWETAVLMFCNSNVPMLNVQYDELNSKIYKLRYPGNA